MEGKWSKVDSVMEQAATEYFAKTAYLVDGLVGLAKITRSERGLFAWFVNRAGEWEMDNRLPAGMSGIGGDNDWHQVDEEAARSIVTRSLLQVELDDAALAAEISPSGAKTSTACSARTSTHCSPRTSTGSPRANQAEKADP